MSAPLFEADPVGVAVARAESLLAVRRPAAARDALVDVAGQGWSDPRWLDTMAQAETDDGRFDEAERVVERGLALAPQDWRMWSRRGALQARRLRLESALADTRRALALAPQEPSLHLQSAALLLTWDLDAHRAEADRAVDDAERCGAAPARVAQLRAELAEHDGRLGTARDLVRAGLRLDPTDDGLRALAVRLMGDGADAWDEAAGALQGMLAESPFDGDAHTELRRRLDLDLVRTRFLVPLAQLVAVLALALSVPAARGVGLVGVVASLLLGPVRETLAVRHWAGAGALRELERDHPGVRTGRAFHAAALVLAWAPAAVGAGTGWALALAVAVSAVGAGVCAWLAARALAAALSAEVAEAVAASGGSPGGLGPMARAQWFDSMTPLAARLETWGAGVLTVVALVLWPFSRFFTPGWHAAVVALAAVAALAWVRRLLAVLALFRAGAVAVRDGAVPAELAGDLAQDPGMMGVVAGLVVAAEIALGVLGALVLGLAMGSLVRI